MRLPFIFVGLIWSDCAAVGADMAVAFLETLAGKEFAEFSRIGLELNASSEEDDQFAAVYGLI